MHNSHEVIRKRIPLFLAMLVVFMTPQFIRDPLAATAMLFGTGFVVGTVAVVVMQFRRHVDSAIPERWIDHRSKAVRASIRVIRGYGMYLVGFYTIILMLLLFHLLGNLI